MKISPDHPVLSKRGQVNHDNLAPLLDFFTDLIHNTYDPNTNPTGIINAGIAENSLNFDDLEPFYADLPLSFNDFTYGDNLGCSQELAQLYAGFLDRKLHPTHAIKDTHVVVGAGVSALIDGIIYAVCDPGDGVLITAPYYNGFDTDLTLRSSAVPIAVNCPESSAPAEIGAALESAYLEQRARGVYCKAVIFCNPHNPLGLCASKELLLTYLNFCRKWQLWLISDEIYAFSIFDTQHSETSSTSEPRESTTTTFAADAVAKAHKSNAFHSVLQLSDAERGGYDRLLMLHGMSKDFCANGFRVGCCVLQHSEDMRTALAANAILGKISGLSDAAFRKILWDSEVCDAFLARNRQRLGAAYAYFTAWCEERNIGYTPSHAGHFIVIDLRPWLQESTFAGESALAKTLVEHGVNISAGEMYHFQQPGFFRFTFSMRRDYLDVALTRLAKALKVKE